MAISKNKRKLLIIFGSAILAVNLVLTILWFAIPWVFTYLGVPEDTIRRGKYTGYDAVVVTSNTSNKTLDELDSYHINYYEYKKGRILFGDGGIINEKDIHNEPKIYLCDGDYETELGSFIDYSGKYPLTICGAGEKETLIIGGSKLYSNSATGIKITAGKDKKLKNSVIKDLSIEGFGFGIELKHTDKTEITNVNIKENHYSGIVFENSDNSNLTNCIFEENGNPKTDDIGYGISLLYESKNNTINAVYKNNGNNNAIDFPENYLKDMPDNNTLKLDKKYTLNVEKVPVRNSKEEAQNAKPTSKSQRFEIENARIDNTGAVLSNSTEKVQKYSGSGWIFLFNTKISLDIDVKEAGKYRIFVVGTSDDGNNKCDFFQVNGGTKYLTSFLGKNKGVWQTCQPGEEYYENDELHPVTPTDGFELKAGKNTIDITANWGYCAYDAVIIEKIG